VSKSVANVIAFACEKMNMTGHKAMTLLVHPNDTEAEGPDGAVPVLLEKSWDWLRVLTIMGASLKLEGPVCRVWDSHGFEVKGKGQLHEGKVIYVTSASSDTFRQGTRCPPPKHNNLLRLITLGTKGDKQLAEEKKKDKKERRQGIRYKTFSLGNKMFEMSDYNLPKFPEEDTTTDKTNDTTSSSEAIKGEKEETETEEGDSKEKGIQEPDWWETT